MATLLQPPRLQFLDGNGDPLSGGSVAFCQPATSGTVFRPVYSDEAATVQLSNPVPLDASGISFSGGSQVSIWGSGKYEVFVRDYADNLIYSALLDAIPDLSNGGTINGALTVTGSISSQSNITATGTITSDTNHTNTFTAANAIITSLTTGTIGNSGTITADTIHATHDSIANDLTAANATLGPTTFTAGVQVNGGMHTNGGVDVDGNLRFHTAGGSQPQPAVSARGGQGTTDGGGNLTVLFSPPFNGIMALVANIAGVAGVATVAVTSCDNNGGVINTSPPGIGVYWIAVGT